MLLDALDDPDFARVLARRLLVPTFPIQGSSAFFASEICSGDATQRTFGGSGCGSPGGDFNFPANLGIGATSPDGKLHIYDSSHDYKVKYIGMQGGDYRKSVILLHAAYNATNLANNYAIGRFFADRGSTGAVNRKEVAETSTGAAYQTTTGALRSVSNDSLKWKLVTCTYNSIKYLALELPYSNSFLASGVSFEGYHKSSVANALTLIDYYNVQTSTALNTEINNSIADFTSYGQVYEDAATYAISGNVGIGTASPQAKLAVQTSGDTDLDIVAGGSYHARLNLGESGGTAGKIDYSNTNDYMTFDTAGAERMRITSAGDVGIGRTDPQAKLHVKGGGITIEDNLGAGRLRFAETGESAGRIDLYRGGRACNATPPGSPDITILRNFPNYSTPTDSCVRYTLLRVWAPKITASAPSDDREATISLVRDLNSTDDDSQEFIDIYNNGYASSGSVQHGIRIQKRTGTTTAQYRDFVFDQYDGTNPKLPIMTLKADRTVGMRSHGDSSNWAGTDSIHATAVVTTSDTTPTTLFSLSLENGRAYFITARVVARRSDGSSRAFYYRAACVFRETSGGTQLQGVQSIATIESSAGLDCTIDIDSASNTARVRVTGLGSATIYWVGTIEYQSVATSS